MDKDQERSVARGIYYGGRTRLTDAEAPDFLCVRSGRTILGIEVTDYYITESDARLRRLSGYGLQLLSGGRVRHKDDAKALRVERVVYAPKGDAAKGREINAIVRRTTIDEPLGRLAALVSDKSAKCARYLQKAPHVDLVINDADHAFAFAKFGELHTHLSRDPVRQALHASQFREVFLVTKGPEGKRVCIPLRAHAFLQEVMIWERLALSPERPEALRGDRALPGLVAALSEGGYGKARLHLAKGEITFSWASVEYSLRKGDGKQLTDRTIPRPGRPLGRSIDRIATQLTTSDLKWGKEFAKVRAGYRSTIDVYFEVREVPLNTRQA